MTSRRLLMMILAILTFFVTTPNAFASKRGRDCRIGSKIVRNGTSFTKADKCTRCRCFYGRIVCNTSLCAKQRAQQAARQREAKKRAQQAAKQRICHTLNAYKKRIEAQAKATRTAYAQLNKLKNYIIASGRRIQAYQNYYKRTRNPVLKRHLQRTIKTLKANHAKMVRNYKAQSVRVRQMAQNVQTMLKQYRSLKSRYPFCRGGVTTKRKCYTRNGKRRCRSYRTFQRPLNFARLSAEMNGIYGGSGPKPRGFEGNFFEGNF